MEERKKLIAGLKILARVVADVLQESGYEDGAYADITLKDRPMEEVQEIAKGLQCGIHQPQRFLPFHWVMYKTPMVNITIQSKTSGAFEAEKKPEINNN